MRSVFRKHSRITRTVLSFLCIAVAYRPAPASAQRAKTALAPREIVEVLLKETLWIDMSAPPIDSVARDVIAAPLDLNADGVPELEVHAINHLCHSNANCPTWIYGRVGVRYERLLDPGNIAWLEVKKTSTHGYRDIMAYRHGSAWISGLTIYKFDGREYQRSACFTRNDGYLDRHGEFRERKKPRVTRVACDPDP